MKRNLDLLKRLLLEIEAADDGRGSEVLLDAPDVNEHVIYGHLKLMQEGGLIQAFQEHEVGRERFRPRRLTWEGQEFLDSIRDPKIWDAIKKKLDAISGAAPIDVIRALAVKLTKQSLGLDQGPKK